jgi:hypothetical protein
MGMARVAKLHRISSSEKPNTSADVIFVHGLGGHHVDTWKAADQAYWPEWLDAVLPSATVCSLEYEASPSGWLGGAMPITDRASNLLALFEAEGIGKRPLIFVAYSLGGLIVKQLLRHSDSYGAQWKHVSQQTRAVVFLAVPHQGSDAAKYLQALKHILRPTVAIAELEANAAALRDLNLWYRNNLERLSIANQVFFETNDTRGVRVVDEASADPGITGVVPIPIDEDHITICKPVSTDALVFKSVSKFVSEHLPNSPEQEQVKPSSPLFSEQSSLAALVTTLDDLFGFRWEKSSFETEHENPLIYWPVRLRHPTPIHAAQCFAASGLQQRGAEIHLFVDDLGEHDFSVDLMVQKLKGWFAMDGGNPNDLRTTHFSNIIPPTEDGPRETARPWPTVRKWLGDTEYRLDHVLKIAKLVSRSGAPAYADLAGKRPRRLLTPALVWSCLEFLHSNFRDRPIMTLGGYDESPLWSAWRDQVMTPTAHVGHLYAPQLSEFDNQHGSIAVHMANPKYSLEWQSKDDIRNALDTEINSGTDWHKTNRLIPWCVNSCIFLPRFFSGEELRMKIAGGEVGLDTSLEQVNWASLRLGLVDELARWII